MIRIGKKLAAILLAVAMAVTFVPIMGAGTVYADEPGEAGGEISWTPLPGTDTISYYLDEEGTLTLQGTGDIPDYDTGANRSPFYGNSEIKKIIIEEGITGIGRYTFRECSVETVTIPTGVKAINDYAFYWCGNLVSADLPEGLESIGSDAFGDCGDLVSADLPEGLRSIGPSAFVGSRLKSIVIPDSVTEIGSYAFNDCSDAKTLKLSSNLEVIPTGAFSSCSKLKSIEIPDGIISLENEAFAFDTELKKVSIPSSVKSMSYTFEMCFGLDEVIFEGNFPSEFDGVFFGCNLTAYYPFGNATWDEEALGYGYGGKVKWVGYCKTHVPAAAVKENVKAATTTQTGSYQQVVYCKVCHKKLSSKTVTIPKLPKKANPLTVNAKTATVKYSKLQKKAQTLAVTKVITFTKKGQGTMSYTLSSAKKGSKSFKKYFKINKTTGKVTIKKNSKMKKGIYKVKVKVKAAGNADYNASAVKTVTFKVNVK